MKVSVAARSAALESLVGAALSSPDDLPKHVEALAGLQLLSERSDELGDEKGERYAQAVDSVFSTAFRIADRPQVRNVVATEGCLSSARHAFTPLTGKADAMPRGLTFWSIATRRHGG